LNFTDKTLPTQQRYRCRQRNRSCWFALAADVSTCGACTSRRCSCTGMTVTSLMGTTWVDCILTTWEVAKTTSCTSVTTAVPRRASSWDRPFNIATPRQVSLVKDTGLHWGSTQIVYCLEIIFIIFLFIHVVLCTLINIFFN